MPSPVALPPAAGHRAGAAAYPAPAQPAADDFIAALRDFLAAVRRARGRVARDTGDELSLSQHHVLLALAGQPELRAGALAEAAGVAPPTASRMLDGLERMGVVTRTPSAQDRRGVTVCLTPKGKRLLERKQREVTARLSAVYEAVAPGEREGAERLLRALAAAMDEL